MRAFTLIEILAAMAVLVILVMFLGRAFNDAAAIFRRGALTVERNGAVQVAMDRIALDLEGLVINDRIACALIRNTTDPNQGFGFDEMWFVTTQSHQTDDTAYHLVRYWVTQETNRFANLNYVTFSLRRDTWMLDRLRMTEGDDVDIMKLPPVAGFPREWWDPSKLPGETPDLLLENIVRFDVWALGDDGNPIDMDMPSTEGGFRSSENQGAYKAGTYPAFFDIYIQAASDETMRQAGRILFLYPTLTASERYKARAQMVRDSNVLLTRVRPFMAPGQRDHPYKYWY